MKPKCLKCKRVLRDVPGGMKTEWQRAKGGTTVCCVCGWSKHVSRAAIIRLAAGKPELCKWTPDEDGNWSPACDPIDALFVFTDGGPKENQMRFCHSCGKPVEVVNG